MNPGADIVYCGKCGNEMGGRPPRPGLSVCPCCLTAIDLKNHETDLFALPVSDLALPTVILEAVEQQRHHILQMQAGADPRVVQAADRFGGGR